MEIEVHALVPDPVLPVRASASTRAVVPKGYGVQEQCLPFTAAASTGLLLRSPFSFGCCAPDAVPAHARAFTPPFRSRAQQRSQVFYVEDRPSSRFSANAFAAEPIPYLDPAGQQHLHSAVHPGLSFFDRADQQHLFKLHLPYVLRTPDGIDSLFMAPINRAAPLQIVTALVETDWYAHPVNLVAHLPNDSSVHISAGDVVAQVTFMHRTTRRAEISAPPPARRQALQHDLLRWYIHKSADRSAYKKLARSRHGRFEADRN
jgi:hypothetical protein